jgi:hypothetical protein
MRREEEKDAKISVAVYILFPCGIVVLRDLGAQANSGCSWISA